MQRGFAQKNGLLRFTQMLVASGRSHATNLPHDAACGVTVVDPEHLCDMIHNSRPLVNLVKSVGAGTTSCQDAAALGVQLSYGALKARFCPAPSFQAVQK
jgi:hypothetical protein